MENLKCVKRNLTEMSKVALMKYRFSRFLQLSLSFSYHISFNFPKTKIQFTIIVVKDFKVMKMKTIISQLLSILIN